MQFLRNRRAQLQPGDVGLPNGLRRRVAGLRREEVALLADVSVDYYLRIEQGRETNPSDQVLDGIARALKLDDETAGYMRDLAREPECANRDAPKEHKRAIDSLISGWPQSPARIHDPGLTVVSTNPIAHSVFPWIGPGTSTLRSLFLEPEIRKFYRNWDQLTAWTMSWVRAYAAKNPQPGLAAVIDELLQESQRFRMLWSRHDVRHDDGGTMEIAHPQVGPLTLHFHYMMLGRCGHVLVVYWAEPGSASARRLQQLLGA